MKINLHTTLVKPSLAQKPLLNEVGIQEMILEDVAQFTFTENNIVIGFNNAPDETIPLRGNDGKETFDWRACSINIIRKFMEVDMNN